MITDDKAVRRRRDVSGPDTLLFYDEPVELTRGLGSSVWDVAGKRYVDAYNNVPHVGHCHPRVVAAGQGALAKLNIHSRYIVDGVTTYAESLLATLPRSARRLFFTCSGTEANDLALRLACLSGGQQGVVVSACSYHGNAGKLASLATAMPTGETFPDWGATIDLEAAATGDALAAAVEAAIARLRAAGIGLAAFIIDPSLCFEGILDRPRDYLTEAIAAVRAAGGLYIADEVQSGFGRMGDGLWGWEYFGVEPDLVTMGKPMANGWPMAAVAAPAPLADRFQRQAVYFNTFASSPVGAAMGQTVLEVIEEEALVAHARQIGARAADRLSSIAGVEQVRGRGLYTGVALGSGPVTRRVIERMRRSGVLVGRTGPAGDVLKMRPPMCFSEADLDQFAESLNGALKPERRVRRMWDMQAFPMIVDGKARMADRTMTIRDPATQDIVGEAPVSSLADAEAAIASARRAFYPWSAMPDAERRASLAAAMDVVEAHSEELARLLTREQGKPLNGMGSRFELGGLSAWGRHTLDLEIGAETIQESPDGRVVLQYRPLGIVASITPWNWPLMIAIWHLMPALRMGNCVVVKPSPFTPLSSLRLVELMNRVLPPGVLNIVTGDAETGDLLSRHAHIAKVIFTGSIATGRKVMAAGADGIKRMTLELGGNDAGIVLPDCEPGKAAEKIFWGAFINGGQTCAALKRLYVHADVHDELCDALSAIAASVPMGHGLDESSLLGPVQNRPQLERVASLVEEAHTDGARILVGGRRSDGPGLFYSPAIVADARDGMRLVDEEQFGPALPIIRYTDVEEALASANRLDFGLAGSVWSGDLAAARAVAARMECGSVWINAHGAVRPDAPFGGWKSSGLGVEFGIHGLRECGAIQVIHG